jgi:SAM-dependent methyltransferase
MKRRLMITVDVEAQPRRAKTDPVETLIHGRFDGADFGMGKMMSLAEKHGAKLICFLDYAEEYLYGDKLLDVGRAIADRGHDLQIHFHPELLPKETFARRGLSYANDMCLVEEDHARFFVDTALASHAKVTSVPPMAFRGGGYRYGQAMLRALKKQGIAIDSSYNPSRVNEQLKVGIRKQFLWEDGLIEVPVSCLFDFKDTGRLFAYNFNATTLLNGTPDRSVQKHIDYLTAFYDHFGEDAIAVMVLHSWSFLNCDQEGYYSSPNQDAVTKFDLLLETLAKEVSFVTSPDVINLMRQGKSADVVAYATNIPMDVMQAKPAPRPASIPDPIPIFRAPDLPGCEICGTKVSTFKDYNGPRRMCSGCGSLERQRTFAALYQAREFPGLDLTGKKILVIAPSTSELLFLRRAHKATLVTLDVRKEAKTDLVADLCAMPHIDSTSYDMVYASHVLSHVYDLAACLSEIHRILKPGGLLINHEPTSAGQPTKPITDLSIVCRHYGVEAYEKYRIGRFRIFGDKDIKRILSSQFDVDLRRVIEPRGGGEYIWAVCRKPVVER